jgi:hypothetical protein
MRPVVDREHLLLPDEDRELCGLELTVDTIELVDHEEDVVVVLVELRSLPGLHGVFDRQGMEVEFLGEKLDVFVGEVDAIDLDPDEVPRSLPQF